MTLYDNVQASRVARTEVRPGREATRGLRRAVRMNDDALIDRNLLLLRAHRNAVRATRQIGCSHIVPGVLTPSVRPS